MSSLFILFKLSTFICLFFPLSRFSSLFFTFLTSQHLPILCVRICLEYEDIPEVNQCQTQLHELYNDDIPGCVPEFTAYRILYNVYISAKYRHGANAMHAILTDACHRGVASDEAVSHALAVRESVEMDDYNAFFQLQRQAPNMSSTMMELLVGRMRHGGMRLICRSFRPTVTIQTVAELLGFSSVEQCRSWLMKESRKGEKEKQGEEEEMQRQEQEKDSNASLYTVVVITEDVIDSKETILNGYFNRPYCFEVMDGDSVTDKKSE